MKHLKLFRVEVEHEFAIELPKALATQRWQLRTLFLEVMPSVDRQREITTSSLCTSILRLCAPTLESLTWESGIARSDSITLAAEARDPKLCFPYLRDLKLGDVKLRDHSILDALVQDGLRSFEVDTTRNPIRAGFFRKHRTIPSLETFVWSYPRIPSTHSLEFLRANTHLSKFSLERRAPAELLERLLSILSTSFSMLKSLSLVWESTSIPESALELISTLKSLEQVHLSAGQQSGWKCDWVIDHESMRKYLEKLPCLRKIALGRDFYCSGPIYHRDQVWEGKHRACVKAEATQYVIAMPKLEWLYVGEYCLGFANFQGITEKEPYLLFEDRHICWTMVRRMFGGKSA